MLNAAEAIALVSLGTGNKLCLWIHKHTEEHYISMQSTPLKVSLFGLNDLLLVIKAKLLWDLRIVKIGPKRAEKCFHGREILLMP